MSISYDQHHIHLKIFCYDEKNRKDMMYERISINGKTY